MKAINEREGHKRARRYLPAPEAIEMIRTQNSANEDRIRSWVLHPDDRVPLELLEAEGNDTDTWFDQKLMGFVHDDTKLTTRMKVLLYKRAMTQAKREGVAWTPLLDGLEFAHRYSKTKTGAWWLGQVDDHWVRDPSELAGALPEGFDCTPDEQIEPLLEWIRSSSPTTEELLPLLDFQHEQLRETVAQQIPRITYELLQQLSPNVWAELLAPESPERSHEELIRLASAIGNEITITRELAYSLQPALKRLIYHQEADDAVVDALLAAGQNNDALLEFLTEKLAVDATPALLETVRQSGSQELMEKAARATADPFDFERLIRQFPEKALSIIIDPDWGVSETGLNREEAARLYLNVRLQEDPIGLFWQLQGELDERLASAGLDLSTLIDDEASWSKRLLAAMEREDPARLMQLVGHEGEILKDPFAYPEPLREIAEELETNRIAYLRRQENFTNKPSIEALEDRLRVPPLWGQKHLPERTEIIRRAFHRMAADRPFQTTILLLQTVSSREGEKLDLLSHDHNTDLVDEALDRGEESWFEELWKHSARGEQKLIRSVEVELKRLREHEDGSYKAQLLDRWVKSLEDDVYMQAFKRGELEPMMVSRSDPSEELEPAKVELLRRRPQLLEEEEAVRDYVGRIGGEALGTLMEDETLLTAYLDTNHNEYEGLAGMLKRVAWNDPQKAVDLYLEGPEMIGQEVPARQVAEIINKLNSSKLVSLFAQIGKAEQLDAVQRRQLRQAILSRLEIHRIYNLLARDPGVPAPEPSQRGQWMADQEIEFALERLTTDPSRFRNFLQRLWNHTAQSHEKQIERVLGPRHFEFALKTTSHERQREVPEDGSRVYAATNTELEEEPQWNPDEEQPRLLHMAYCRMSRSSDEYRQVWEAFNQEASVVALDEAFKNAHVPSESIPEVVEELLDREHEATVLEGWSSNRQRYASLLDTDHFDRLREQVLESHAFFNADQEEEREETTTTLGFRDHRSLVYIAQSLPDLDPEELDRIIERFLHYQPADRLLGCIEKFPDKGHRRTIALRALRETPREALDALEASKQHVPNGTIGQQLRAILEESDLSSVLSHSDPQLRRRGYRILARISDASEREEPSSDSMTPSPSSRTR